MILYNVTVKVEKTVHEEWLRWMQQVHIPDVMATGKFEEHKLCRILHEEPDGVTYAIQYFAPDMPAFQRYQAEDAKRLQAEHMERFKDKYVAFRTLMEVL